MPIEDNAWTVITPGTYDVSTPEALDVLHEFGNNLCDTAGGAGVQRVRWRRNAGRFDFALWAAWGTSPGLLADLGGLNASWEALVSSSSPDITCHAAVAYDYSASTVHEGTAFLIRFSGGYDLRFSFDGVIATATVPFTWATGDWLIAGTAVESFDN